MTKKNNVEILHKEKTNIENDSEIEHKKNPFVFNMSIDTKKKKLTVDRGSEVETEEGFSQQQYHKFKKLIGKNF
jgi:hypothetical protein